MNTTQDKEMRRIQERQEMPTDKGELIQHLSERIKQAEVTLLIKEGSPKRHIRSARKLDFRTIKNIKINIRKKPPVIKIV